MAKFETEIPPNKKGIGPPVILRGDAYKRVRAEVQVRVVAGPTISGRTAEEIEEPATTIIAAAP